MAFGLFGDTFLTPSTPNAASGHIALWLLQFALPRERVSCSPDELSNHSDTTITISGQVVRVRSEHIGRMDPNAQPNLDH